METLKPTLKRGRNVWDQVNMPATEFQNRLDKIQGQMEKESIDVLFLFSNGPDEYANPCYVSNYYVGMGNTLVVVPRKGKVTLFFTGSGRGIQYEKATTPIEDTRPGDMFRESVKYLNENKLIHGTVGLVGFNQLMPYPQLQAFRETLKSYKIIDADHILTGLRLIKSPRESDEVRRASRVASHTFAYMADADFIDMREIILDAAVDREARMEGAEDVRVLIGRPGENNWSLRPADDSPISSGETIIVYLAVEYERYWAENIRTFMVQPPRLVSVKSEKGTKIYEKVLGKLTPKQKMSLVYKTIIGELDKSGIQYSIRYGLGQGIGLKLQEMPVIAANDATVLKAGMCLTLRLALKDREVGDMMIGNTVYLSKDGPEVLTL